MKELQREPQDMSTLKSLRPGPIENFDLVYLSPKYQSQVGKED